MMGKIVWNRPRCLVAWSIVILISRGIMRQTSVPASDVTAEDALWCPPCFVNVVGDLGQDVGHVMWKAEKSWTQWKKVVRLDKPL